LLRCALLDSNMKEQHGNTGKRNAAKDSTQDATLCFRLTKEQKAAYLKAAGNRKLKDWVLSALDKAAL
jgi:hypothetical protein